MQLAIHSDRRNIINAIDTTSINSQNVLNMLLKSFAQIKIKLNMKISKIKRFYKSKEKNLLKILLLMIIIKFFDIIKHATNYEYASMTKTTNEYFEK